MLLMGLKRSVWITASCNRAVAAEIFLMIFFEVSEVENMSNGHRPIAGRLLDGVCSDRPIIIVNLF